MLEEGLRALITLRHQNMKTILDNEKQDDVQM